VTLVAKALWDGRQKSDGLGPVSLLDGNLILDEWPDRLFGYPQNRQGPMGEIYSQG